MNTPIDPHALFRLSVLGPLASRTVFKHGELKHVVRELASACYKLPDGRSAYLSEKTIERWYYAWRRQGIDGLVPKARVDRGRCQLPERLQQAIISAKQAKPERSINQIIRLLEQQGTVAKGQLAKATVHRLLRAQQCSGRSCTGSELIERRSFESQYGGDLWQADVMHGPCVQTPAGLRKTYLISLLDDASRLACHTQFYFDEQAVSIEHAFKQALLKRGLPKRMMVDNGPGYRATSLQGICARLSIQLIYCKAYEPQAKGKIERWHRTLREQFLTEIQAPNTLTLDDLNRRLWAFIDTLYHQTAHAGLAGQTPFDRWHADLPHMQPLGHYGQQLDQLFYHRIQRKVRKDGTIGFSGLRFEVPSELAGKTLMLVIDPHEANLEQAIKGLESMGGDSLGPAYPLDKQANLSRTRLRPTARDSTSSPTQTTDLLVEQAHTNYQQQLTITQAFNAKS